ncbi:hypothetical protein J3F83DRAFT_534538 [Trichoderma novae-zelandiae]
MGRSRDSHQSERFESFTLVCLLDAANQTGVRQLAIYGIWELDGYEDASNGLRMAYEPHLCVAPNSCSSSPYMPDLTCWDAYRSESGWWHACKECVALQRLDLETRQMKQTTGHHAYPSHRISARPGYAVNATPAELLGALQSLDRQASGSDSGIKEMMMFGQTVAPRLGAFRYFPCANMANN